MYCFFVDEPQNMTTVQYLPRRHQRGIDLFDLLLRNGSFKIQIFIDSFLTIFSYYVQFNNCLDFAVIYFSFSLFFLTYLCINAGDSRG